MCCNINGTNNVLLGLSSDWFRRSAYNHWDYGYQYANFQDAFYDYSNMADNYGTEASALLLYHAGVSVNMGYGVDGSGAQVLAEILQHIML